MNDLFIIATKRAYRYPSVRGELTTEQLWELPLIGKNSQKGFDLDSVAREINRLIRLLSEDSFVSTKTNPAKTDAENKLEIVKYVISLKQAEIKEAESRVERAEKRRVILDALAKRETEELTKSTREELLEKLAELDTAN